MFQKKNQPGVLEVMMLGKEVNDYSASGRHTECGLFLGYFALFVFRCAFTSIDMSGSTRLPLIQPSWHQ